MALARSTISYAFADTNTPDQSTDGVACRITGLIFGIAISFYNGVVSRTLRDS